MGEFREQIFEDQAVILDGNRYAGCTFRRCTLRFSGAAPAELISNHFEESSFSFDGASATTLNFLSALYQNGSGFREIIEATFENVRKGVYLK